MFRAVVVIPNWNGQENLGKCLDSLLAQSLEAHVIVVDNGSVDGSVEFLEDKYPGVELIKHSENKGFSGGVNAGFKRAIEIGADYVAAFNNDAVADKDWLKNLVEALDEKPDVGIVTCKLLSADGSRLDSTGDYYTVWGLPYPRGRGESDINKYDGFSEIFAASGGASLYRIKTLKRVGLFDEHFFAYYEDVDLSFRAQLAGWKVLYVPKSIAYHQISATSSKIKGFATYQTLKNLPILLYKNVPNKYLWHVAWRFWLAYWLFWIRALTRGQVMPVIKGLIMGNWYSLTGHLKRRRVQRGKKVSDRYIWSMIVHDLPPNARALRRLRSAWWRLRGKK